MSKFIPYESPSDYLARKSYFLRNLRSLYFRYNRFDDELTMFDHELMMMARDPHSKLSPYFLGGLNPLRTMKKDVVDTFKPYKSNHYIYRDLMQPIRGMGNIVRGLFNTVAAPIIFLVNTPRYASQGVTHRNFGEFAKLMAMNSVKTGGGLLDGITSIIRGAVQVASTPLTIIKTLFRGIITAIKGKPTVCQNVEKRVEKLETLIQEEEKTLEDTIAIDRQMRALRVTIVKALKRGQTIGVNTDAIEQNIDATYRINDDQRTRKNALDFLGLFKKNAVVTPVEPTEADHILGRRNTMTENTYM